jgi:hypothetical protein
MRTADLGAPARNGGRDAVLFREVTGASQLLAPLRCPLTYGTVRFRPRAAHSRCCDAALAPR